MRSKLTTAVLSAALLIAVQAPALEPTAVTTRGRQWQHVQGQPVRNVIRWIFGVPVVAPQQQPQG